MYSIFERKKCSNCLICFSSFDDEVTFSSLFTYPCICQNCQKKFHSLLYETRIDGINTLFLYEYNDFLREIIYRYKGCYDYALKEVFLHQYKRMLKRRYWNYTILFPPSNEQEDCKRKFQHVPSLCQCLHLPIEDLFYKKENYKQSNMTYLNRQEIQNKIELKRSEKIVDKKYLVVDDIFTSGNTLRTIYAILKKNHVKKENISGLIVAKVIKSVKI